MELARREFWYYCHLMAPDFYTPDRGYLKDLCGTLQEFYEDPDAGVLVLNLPPRHGKSRTAGLFVQWVLGTNPAEKIMTGSYNETLSTMFAKSVRNAIQEEKADAARVVYRDIFPGVEIKDGDGAMNLWSLKGHHNSYLATSPTGTATGFGCSIMIIDDLIKNAAEAYNAGTLAKHWEWFTNTMLSRLEEGGKIIVIMTRWALGDLAGRVIKAFGPRVRVVKEKAVQEDGTMLCPDILSYERFKRQARVMGADIVAANYQQEPVDVKGRLYTAFKTYDRLPDAGRGRSPFECIKNYTDTADTGSDFLCSIVYGVFNNYAYVLDLIYTQEPMEKTEPATAEMLARNGVNIADIESNNGGRGFARSVENILRTRYPGNRTTVRPFHQSQNKKARILSNATWLCEHVIYPANWRDRWPEYYEAMTNYVKEGANAHDDAPDATTGIVEKMTENAAPVAMFVNY